MSLIETVRTSEKRLMTLDVQKNFEVQKLDFDIQNVHLG